MFGSSLPPIMSHLIGNLCLFAHSGVQHILCCGCFFLWFKQYLLSKTYIVKYIITTKHERGSESRFPYTNPSPCNNEYWIRRAYIKQDKVYQL